MRATSEPLSEPAKMPRCGKLGVVGAQHNKPVAVTGGEAKMCGRYQASE